MTKALISSENQKARQTFAEQHVVWTENCKILESSLASLMSDGKQYACHLTGKRLNPVCKEVIHFLLILTVLTFINFSFNRHVTLIAVLYRENIIRISTKLMAFFEVPSLFY